MTSGSQLQQDPESRRGFRGKTLRDAGITGRSIGVGCAMSALIAVGAPYGRQIIQGTAMALTSVTPAAFFLLFVLLLSVHILLGLCRPSWAFRRNSATAFSP